LRKVEIPARAFLVEGKNHRSFNADLGTPDDKPMEALFEFVADIFEKVSKDSPTRTITS
jgi:hypothetical protein